MRNLKPIMYKSPSNAQNAAKEERTRSNTPLLPWSYAVQQIITNTLISCEFQTPDVKLLKTSLPQITSSILLELFFLQD